MHELINEWMNDSFFMKFSFISLIDHYVIRRESQESLQSQPLYSKGWHLIPFINNVFQKHLHTSAFTTLNDFLTSDLSFSINTIIVLFINHGRTLVITFLWRKNSLNLSIQLMHIPHRKSEQFSYAHKIKLKHWKFHPSERAIVICMDLSNF